MGFWFEKAQKERVCHAKNDCVRKGTDGKGKIAAGETCFCVSSYGPYKQCFCLDCLYHAIHDELGWVSQEHLTEELNDLQEGRR